MESIKYIVLVAIVAILGIGIYSAVTGDNTPPKDAAMSDVATGDHRPLTDTQLKALATLAATPDNPKDSSPPPAPDGSSQQGDGPPTGPGDPYATGQKALGASEYQQEKADLLSRTKMAGSAAECRVIAEVEARVIGTSGMQAISRREEDAGLSTYHPELYPAVQAAEAEGLKMGAAPGGCDYWRQNPDAVSQMRDLAHLADMP